MGVFKLKSGGRLTDINDAKKKKKTDTKLCDCLRIAQSCTWNAFDVGEIRYFEFAVNVTHEIASEVWLKKKKKSVQTLDSLPLSHPEHFGTPVLKKQKNARGRAG